MPTPAEIAVLLLASHSLTLFLIFLLLYIEQLYRDSVRLSSKARSRSTNSVGKR